MPNNTQQLATQLQQRFGADVQSCTVAVGEVTIEVASQVMLQTMQALRDETPFQFEQLIDISGVDYSQYGLTEWGTQDSTSHGFSRGVNAGTAGRMLQRSDELSVEHPVEAGRFAAVYHLLSVRNNQRLRVRVYAPDDDLPVIPSVIQIWNSADWYEREAFDLFGIIFEGHPDLRRILTDYGFVGHPFRKDFPLSGNVEVRYDPIKKRVVYQPVSIEPRVLVPKVIREDVPRQGHVDAPAKTDSA